MATKAPLPSSHCDVQINATDRLPLAHAQCTTFKSDLFGLSVCVQQMTMFLVRTAARTAVRTNSCRSFCVSHTQLSDRKVSLASGDSYIIIIITTRDSFSFRSVRLRVLVQMLCRFMRENVAVCIFYHIKRCLCVYRVWCWECLRRRRRRMRALFT